MHRFNAFLLGGLLGAIPGYFVGGFLAFMYIQVVVGVGSNRVMPASFGFLMTLLLLPLVAFIWWGGARNLRAYDEQEFSPARQCGGIGALVGVLLGLTPALFAMAGAMRGDSAALGGPMALSTPFLGFYFASTMVVGPGLLCAGIGALVGALSGQPSPAPPVRRPLVAAGPGLADGPYVSPAFAAQSGAPYMAPGFVPQPPGDALEEEVRSAIEGRWAPNVLEYAGHIEWEPVEHPGARNLVMRGRIAGTDVRVRASALRGNGGAAGLSGKHVVFQMPSPARWPALGLINPEWLVASGVNPTLAAHLAGPASAGTLEEMARAAWTDPESGITYTAEVNSPDHVGGSAAPTAGCGYTIVAIDLCSQGDRRHPA